MYDIEKLRRCFPKTTVFKSQSIASIFKTSKIESFLRDWILARKANEDGQIEDRDELAQYITRLIPSQEDRLLLEDEARSEGATRPFLAKLNILFHSDKNYWSFEIPDLGFKHSKTLIEDYVWDRIKENFQKKSGGWGLVRIGYQPPEERKNNGRFTLLEYKNFCPYRVNLDAYRQARMEYDDTEEWMNVLLGALDYDSDGFNVSNRLQSEIWNAKHTLLTRLIPFVQSRVNLIELAPQQTGKSYIFGKVGKYGWIASSGSMTRAKLFASMNSGQPDGLVTNNDFVAFDEVKKLNFTNDDEMSGSLKNYMEDGYLSVGTQRVDGEAGIIFLGNIDPSDNDDDKDMLRELPSFFRDSALLQRIHGFIPGRYMFPIDPKMLINNWALNSEYFTEIMHLMRSQAETMRYRSLVEELVEVRSRGETSNRERNAVLLLCTGYLKLFFPHADEELIQTAKFREEFDKYCLSPAVRMQQTVLSQMKIVNPNEFGMKSMSSYSVRTF